MKECKRCNLMKSFSLFSQRKTRAGYITKHSWCNSCSTAYKREWINKKVRLLRNHVFEYLSNNPCVVCGSDDLLVLEFDHKDPTTKSFNIGKAISGKTISISLEELIAEINKCEVMCRNCHQRKTHKDNRSWRWQILKEKEEDSHAELVL